MISLFLAKIGVTGIVGSIVAVLFAGYAAFLRADNARLASELSKSRETSGRLSERLSAANAAITAQNAHVEEYKAESDYLVARLKGADVKVQSIAKVSGHEIERIEKAPVPAGCDAAASWLASEAPGIVKRWNDNK